MSNTSLSALLASGSSASGDIKSVQTIIGVVSDGVPSAEIPLGHAVDPNKCFLSSSFASNTGSAPYFFLINNSTLRASRYGSQGEITFVVSILELN